MIQTELHTIDGDEIIVLLVQPNWTTPFAVRYELATDISTGRTGIEHRRPDADAMRLTLAYDALLKDSEWQTWRDTIGQLNGRRVAMPIWSDVLPAADWGNRTHTGQRVIGWNEGLANIAIGTADSLPARTYLAPLVIGRLEHLEQDALTGKTAVIQVELTEDRDYTQRVTPSGTDGAWSWAPDWVGERTETTADFLELDTIGRGARKTVEGDSAVRISQTAQFTLKRAQFAQFLAFWNARRGSYEGFVAPSPWTPGNETPAAPHLFDGEDGKGLLRFEADSLEVEWHTTDLVQFTTSFQQIIDAEGEEEHPAFGFLYRFFRLDDASLTERVTDREAPISFGGHTWKPANIKHDNMRQSMELQDEDCEITAYLDDIALLNGVARHELEAPLWVEILEYNASTGEANSLFMGKVTKTRAKGKQITLHASLFGGVLARQAPRYLLSRTCNFSVFDGACSRAGLDKANYEATGLFDYQTSDYHLALTSVSVPASYTTWTEPTKLRGQIIGTATAQSNDHVRYGRDRVFDGREDTYFSAAGSIFSVPYVPGAWVGLDTGEPHGITKVRFRPRIGFPHRMVGGQIQASNSLSGPWTTLHQIVGAPPDGWTELTYSGTTLFRYMRYWNNNPISGNSQIAELEFYGRRTVTEYYSGGWVETGTGANRQTRPIIRAEYFPASHRIHLVLLRPLRTDIISAGQTVKFWPGCDGNFSTCRDKFGNQQIFGGLPFVPAYMEEKVGTNDMGGK